MMDSTKSAEDVTSRPQLPVMRRAITNMRQFIFRPGSEKGLRQLRQLSRYMEIIGKTILTAVGIGFLLAPFSRMQAAESLALKLSNEEFGPGIKSRALTAEIGDSLSGEFSPEFKLTAWGGESVFRVFLATDSAAQFDKPSHIMVGGKTGISVAQGGNIRHQLYQRPDSGLEWEIIYDSIPKSNIISFQIQQTGLEFFYQDGLTGDEISSSVERPDSVVGSYAVYHTGKIGNRLETRGKDTTYSVYETGKVFHVYRPKAHDSRGWTVWCDLIIDSALTIVIPQNFVDKADYPIMIDPTFGNTNIGSSAAYLSASNAQALCGSSSYRYTATAGDIITSYSIYCLTYTNPSYVSFAAYTYAGGYPDSRLSPSVQITVANSSMQWNTTSTVSQGMIGGSTYVVAWGDVSPPSTIRARYDSESNASSLNTGAGLTSTWIHSSYGGNRWSMYATYTAGAASSCLRRRNIVGQILSILPADSLIPLNH